MPNQQYSFVTSSTTTPTLRKSGFSQLLHFEPLTLGWQNKVVSEYYSGERGHAEISERNIRGRERSIVFQTANTRDTLYDHPPSESRPSSGSRGCYHDITTTFDHHESKLSKGGYEYSMMCKGCSKVFRNFRYFGELWNGGYEGWSAS